MSSSKFNIRVSPLVCSLCKRSDNMPEKYGEKITLQQHNLTVHYFCLVSQMFSDVDDVYLHNIFNLGIPFLFFGFRNWCYDTLP